MNVADVKFLEALAEEAIRGYYTLEDKFVSKFGAEQSAEYIAKLQRIQKQLREASVRRVLRIEP